MPEILDAALRYKADLARREATAMRSMANHYANIMRGLGGEIADLARTMAARRAQGLEVTAGYLYRTERYQQLLAQANREFRKYEEFAGGIISEQEVLFARLGREHGIALLDILEPGIAGSFNRLNTRAIEQIAGMLEPGSPLRALLADAWPGTIAQTTNALVRGVGLGYGPRRIAQMMREGMNSGLYRSLVIARTETHRAYRTTKHDFWRGTGLVRGFQRVANHDRRTCPACLFSDGEYYDAAQDLAEHPQGRCIAIPVLRNSSLHKWEYGPEWFEKQPPGTQISILGPGRLAAWLAGRFDLRDVPQQVPHLTWGMGLRARGLRELVGG